MTPDVRTISTDANATTTFFCGCKDPTGPQAERLSEAEADRGGESGRQARPSQEFSCLNAKARLPQTGPHPARIQDEDIEAVCHAHPQGGSHSSNLLGEYAARRDPWGCLETISRLTRGSHMARISSGRHVGQTAQALYRKRQACRYAVLCFIEGIWKL